MKMSTTLKQVLLSTALSVSALFGAGNAMAQTGQPKAGNDTTKLRDLTQVTTVIDSARNRKIDPVIEALASKTSDSLKARMVKTPGKHYGLRDLLGKDANQLDVLNNDLQKYLDFSEALTKKLGDDLMIQIMPGDEKKIDKKNPLDRSKYAVTQLKNDAQWMMLQNYGQTNDDNVAPSAAEAIMNEQPSTLLKNNDGSVVTAGMIKARHKNKADAVQELRDFTNAERNIFAVQNLENADLANEKIIEKRIAKDKKLRNLRDRMAVDLKNPATSNVIQTLSASGILDQIHKGEEKATYIGKERIEPKDAKPSDATRILRRMYLYAGKDGALALGEAMLNGESDQKFTGNSRLTADRNRVIRHNVMHIRSRSEGKLTQNDIDPVLTNRDVIQAMFRAKNNTPVQLRDYNLRIMENNIVQQYYQSTQINNKKIFLPQHAIVSERAIMPLEHGEGALNLFDENAPGVNRQTLYTLGLKGRIGIGNVEKAYEKGKQTNFGVIYGINGGIIENDFTPGPSDLDVKPFKNTSATIAANLGMDVSFVSFQSGFYFIANPYPKQNDPAKNTKRAITPPSGSSMARYQFSANLVNIKAEKWKLDVAAIAEGYDRNFGLGTFFNDFNSTAYNKNGSSQVDPFQEEKRREYEANPAKRLQDYNDGNIAQPARSSLKAGVGLNLGILKRLEIQANVQKHYGKFIKSDTRFASGDHIRDVTQGLKNGDWIVDVGVRYNLGGKHEDERAQIIKAYQQTTKSAGKDTTNIDQYYTYGQQNKNGSSTQIKKVSGTDQGYEEIQHSFEKNTFDLSRRSILKFDFTKHRTGRAIKLGL